VSTVSDEYVKNLAAELAAPDSMVDITREAGKVNLLITRPARHLPPDFSPPESLGVPRELVRNARFTQRAWEEFLTDALSRELLPEQYERLLEASGPPQEARSDDEAARAQLLVILTAIVLMLLALASTNARAKPRRPATAAAEERIASATLNIASFVAVGVREQAREEWIAEQMAGQAGEVESADSRVRFSLGLVWAALRIRGSRVADPFVDLFDLIVGGVALYVFQEQGLLGVIANAENLSVIGGVPYAVARLRRLVLKRRDEIAGVISDSE
jgi:hypothetical protein